MTMSGPYSSDGIPITSGQRFSARIVQNSGSAQTFPKVQFGVSQLEPKGGALPPHGGGANFPSSGYPLLFLASQHGYTIDPSNAEGTYLFETSDSSVAMRRALVDVDNSFYVPRLTDPLSITKTTSAGDTLWTRTNPFSYTGGSIIGLDQLRSGDVIVSRSTAGGDNPHIVRLNVDTGSTVWAENIGGTSIGSPRLATWEDEYIYTLLSAGWLRRLDPADGSVLASLNMSWPSGSSTAIAVGADRSIFIANSDGRVHRRAPDGLSSMWEQQVGGGVLITDLATDWNGGRLYSSHADGTLRLWDVDTGDVLWVHDSPGNEGIGQVWVSPDGFVFYTLGDADHTVVCMTEDAEGVWVATFVGLVDGSFDPVASPSGASHPAINGLPGFPGRWGTDGPPS